MKPMWNAILLVFVGGLIGWWWKSAFDHSTADAQSRTESLPIHQLSAQLNSLTRDVEALRHRVAQLQDTSANTSPPVARNEVVAESVEQPSDKTDTPQIPPTPDTSRHPRDSLLNSAFMLAAERFANEGFDADWAYATEDKISQFLQTHPHTASLSINALNCKTSLCWLSLPPSDYASDWSPAVGQMSEQPWWPFGQVYFNLAPQPGRVAEYELLLQRHTPDQPALDTY